MQLELIFQRIREYLQRLRRKWPVPVIWGALFAGLMLLNSSFRPTIYIARTIFHPEAAGDQGGNAANSALSLLFGPSAEQGGANFMIGILKSRYISEAVVADTILYEGQRHLLADLVLARSPRASSLFNAWRLLRKEDPAAYSYQSKIVSAARQLRNALVVMVRDDGFISMEFSFFEPALTGLISETFIRQLDAYYKRQRTEKAVRNVEFFTHRSDSVKRELDKTTRALAGTQDRSRFNLFSIDRVYPAELEVKRDMLTQMYVSLVVSKEQALAQLMQDTPIIQVLDPPAPPFDVLKASYLLYAMIGLFAGLVLGAILAVRPLLAEDLGQAIRQALASSASASPDADE
ncbi:MAG: hypothetical protein NW241_04515 [Bacteroidia bacterium]|nr:hypothetical protein [Bacteroidia bacterium]